MLKAYLIALMPIIIIWWIALWCVSNFIVATSIVFGVASIIGLMIWWIKFCVDNFSDDDFD